VTQADIMDAKYGARTGQHNLRCHKPCLYSHLHSTTHQGDGVTLAVKTVEEDDGEPLATAQMSMKHGIKVFGQDAVNTVGVEIKQLHDRLVMLKAKHAKELTHKERTKALAYLMFLKRKRTGQVKGRGCADGQKQRAYTDKELATAPTVATEAVFLTAVIDCYERRDVAIVDVPGAFMQTDQPVDELVHVCLTGIMVDLLLEIDNEMYAPFFVYEGKEKVL
jgi:hypothetical protein